MATYDDFPSSRPAAAASATERAAFLARAYFHLFGAIVVFTTIELLLYRNGWMEALALRLGGNWILVLGGFLVVGWLARSAAHQTRSRALQYAALGGFVLAEALIFAPLLWIAASYAPGVLQSAAVTTLAGFTALTGLALWSRSDFSFLRVALGWAGISALLLIGASLLFGWHLGTWFSVGMIAVAGASILYDTGQIVRRYPTDRHVGASLELFASIALLFWYVLRLFLASRD